MRRVAFVCVATRARRCPGRQATVVWLVAALAFLMPCGGRGCFLRMTASARRRCMGLMGVCPMARRAIRMSSRQRRERGLGRMAARAELRLGRGRRKGVRLVTAGTGDAPAVGVSVVGRDACVTARARAHCGQRIGRVRFVACGALSLVAVVDLHVDMTTATRPRRHGRCVRLVTAGASRVCRYRRRC